MQSIELDACLTGIGAYYNNMVYHYQFKTGEVSKMFNIAQIEMWNVFVALRIWGHQWSSKSVNIKCDNEVAVSVINTGATRDVMLGTMARNIWLETASKDIKLKLTHIAGKDNCCADLLSRWHLVNNRDKKLLKSN